jgi:hypothetical protein
VIVATHTAGIGIEVVRATLAATTSRHLFCRGERGAKQDGRQNRGLCTRERRRAAPRSVGCCAKRGGSFLVGLLTSPSACHPWPSTNYSETTIEHKTRSLTYYNKYSSLVDPPSNKLDPFSNVQQKMVVIRNRLLHLRDHFGDHFLAAHFPLVAIGRRVRQILAA